MFSPTPPPFSLLGQRVCSSQTPSAPVMEIVPMRFSSPFRSALSRIGIIPGKISLVTHMTYPCAIGESMFSVAARTGSELARGTGVQESFLVDRASSPKHPSLAGAYRISGVETISAAMKKIIDAVQVAFCMIGKMLTAEMSDCNGVLVTGSKRTIIFSASTNATSDVIYFQLSACFADIFVGSLMPSLIADPSIFIVCGKTCLCKKRLELINVLLREAPTSKPQFSHATCEPMPETPIVISAGSTEGSFDFRLRALGKTHHGLQFTGANLRRFIKECDYAIGVRN